MPEAPSVVERQRVASEPVLRVADRRARWRARAHEGWWAAIDQLLHSDGQSQRLAKVIRSRQRVLSREVNSRSWLLYLELEELQMRRSLRWVEIVARWERRRGAFARRPRRRIDGG